MRASLIALLAGAACLSTAAESGAQQQLQPPPPGTPAPPHERHAPAAGGQAAHAPRPGGPPVGQPGAPPQAGPHGHGPGPTPGQVFTPPRIPAPGAGVARPAAPAQPFDRRAPNVQPMVPTQPFARQPGPPGSPSFVPPMGEQHRAAPGAPGFRRPPGLPQLGDWNRTLRGVNRDQAGRAWRQGHPGWDSAAPWRRDRNWWRGNDAFRLFNGPRFGFFFIPELGYIAAPPEYDRRHWAPGERLPQWFLRYVVEDYWTYGLPAPPHGCAWVWVNTDVALVDMSDGYILDIVHNVW